MKYKIYLQERKGSKRLIASFIDQEDNIKFCYRKSEKNNPLEKNDFYLISTCKSEINKKSFIVGYFSDGYFFGDLESFNAYFNKGNN